jgi:hypothetical protein
MEYAVFEGFFSIFRGSDVENRTHQNCFPRVFRAKIRFLKLTYSHLGGQFTKFSDCHQNLCDCSFINL